MKLHTLLLFVTLLTRSTATADDPGGVGFSRIIHGWTNYSTGFTATIDTDEEAGDYASIASFYTPMSGCTPTGYGVIVVWVGENGQHLRWENFDYRVCIWSSLSAFTNAPRTGDVLTAHFAAPDGGSTSERDAITRGGRAAYYLYFSLTNTPVTLLSGHTYLVGFAASTFVEDNGELYVPTAPHSGPSDVQAGDLVRGGWQYLTNLGGNTIYSGQLATELHVEALPQLRIHSRAAGVEVMWPATFDGFALEIAEDLRPDTFWSPLSGIPSATNGWNTFILQIPATAQLFRLRKTR